MGTTLTHMLSPGTIPFEFEESKFDPMFGFEETGRKERKIDVSLTEMDSQLVPDKRRDFCAKELMEYQKCMYENFPVWTKCSHQFHHYGHCQYEDYIVRMKEYERERRLMARAKRVGVEQAGYKVVPAES